MRVIIVPNSRVGVVVESWTMDVDSMQPDQLLAEFERVCPPPAQNTHFEWQWVVPDRQARVIGQGFRIVGRIWRIDDLPMESDLKKPMERAKAQGQGQAHGQGQGQGQE